MIEAELKASNSKIRLVRPEGTYQVWLDFREVFTDTKEMFKTVISKSKIGFKRRTLVWQRRSLIMRMNVATEQNRVRDAIRKIIAAVL